MSGTKPTFVYWKIAARAQLPMLLLHAGNVPFEWDDATANAWPSEKPNAPFGQLPLLYHDGVRIAQSGAIARYCAKMAKLWPANDWKAEVLCDMVMEQCNDIFGLFARAKYAGDQVAQADAWDKVRNEKMPKHLGDLESLLASRAGGPFFGGPLPNAADVAVFSTVLLAEKAGIFKSVEKFPGLKGICDAVRGMGTVNDYVAANVPPYFKSS